MIPLFYLLVFFLICFQRDINYTLIVVLLLFFCFLVVIFFFCNFGKWSGQWVKWGKVGSGWSYIFFFIKNYPKQKLLLELKLLFLFCVFLERNTYIIHKQTQMKIVALFSIFLFVFCVLWGIFLFCFILLINGFSLL